MKKIKIGIIGFGKMGQKFLSEFLKNDLWEVVYICDISDGIRERALKLYPNIKVVADEDIVINDKDVDVVGLFTLSDVRYEQILKSVDKRKHIIAEKPVAMTIQQEQAIANIVDSYDRMVTVNIFNRNAWYHHLMQQYIDAGEIGELAIIRICHMTPGFVPGEGHSPEGPSFHDCGMHYVDVARWYANSEYKSWHAQGLRMWDYHQPWWLQVHGTFENGIVFDITQGFIYGHLSEKQTHNSYVDLIGTKGIVRMSHDFINATIDLHGITQTQRITKSFNDKKIDVLVDVFGRSIIENRDLGFPKIKDAVIASDMAWKFYYNALENDLPSIGSQETLNEIIEKRKIMTDGYGLPNRSKIYTIENEQNVR